MDDNGRPQEAKDLQVYSGLHGAFAESLPDAWGMLLMDRFFRSAFDLGPRHITPLDRLVYMADRGMGALGISQRTKSTVQRSMEQNRRRFE